MKKDYFEEKTHQIEPAKMTAFGINIESRYGNAGEIIEMINFSRIAAQNNIAHYVERVEYDSKAGYCNFELDDSVVDGDPIANSLRNAALKAISQFDWFGIHEHGDPFE